MKKIDLTEGNVRDVIVTLALPIMGSSLLQLTYNLVDMLWVGGLGSDSVASIGTSSFFIGLGHSINSLVVIGTGIKVAHSIGEKNEREVKEYLNSGLFLNLIIGIIYSTIIIVTGKKLIGFFDLNNPIVEKNGYLYLAFSAPTLIFTFFNLLYIRVLSSFGNNKSALKISALGIIINIILDPILIYSFKMGVLGAAIATLLSNILMFILFNIKGKEMLTFDLSVGIRKENIIKITRLGFPMAFQRVLFTFVNIVLAKIISTFGSDAIAAQKIGLQIESIMLMVVGGLNGAVSSFVGQNYGAKRNDRVIKGYNISLLIGTIYAAVASIIFIIFPEFLVKLFVREKETIIIGASYLRIVGLSQIFAAIEMISNGMFTGIGKPKIPAFISMIFTVLRIPMALFLIKGLGINGVWISISVSSVLKGITAYLMYRYKIWRSYKNVIQY